MDVTIKNATTEGESKNDENDKPPELNTDPGIITHSNVIVQESKTSQDKNSSAQKSEEKSQESMENSQNSLENLQKIKEKIQSSIESLDNNENRHPNLNRTASDDKSEEYMDAVDNAQTPPTQNNDKPQEGDVNNESSAVNSNQDNATGQTPNRQPFQSEYMTEQNHPTKMVIKRISLPANTQTKNKENRYKKYGESSKKR
ncbi:unnamed protein product [Psylliodes chrysocephalus]|uniref:Uncharacterized protein n=1 Tax=Psylliodes chrysocephalus TaxID=3402493 RepID=A0A9P0CHF4_9CUCU|nr:unnamed protein product [Psylliodes chrysocephala]